MRHRLIVCLALLAPLHACTTRVATEDSMLDSWAQAPRVNLAEYRSIQERTGDQSGSLVVAAAISGGGHRAANFGVGVLMALEEMEVTANSNVLQEIDYFSTVSGGGFAVGSYLSTLYDYLGAAGENTEDRYRDFRYVDHYDDASADNADCRSVCRVLPSPYCVRRNIERGYHAPLLSALTSPQIWFTNFDRGDVLEQKIDRHLLASCWRKDRRSLVLGDIWIPAGSPRRPDLPYWVMNSTVYENGAIFPFTPDVARRYGISAYNHNLDRFCVGVVSNGCEAVVDYGSIPLAVGLKASATFPGAVAATTLQSKTDSENPYLHLFDGGLSDNLGVLTAMDLLAQDSGAAESSSPVKKVLIVIDAYKSDPEPFSNLAGSPTVLFHVSSRLRSIGLDSWRGRHRHVLEKMRVADDIEIVYLSFDTLEREDGDLRVNRDCAPKEQVLGVARSVATKFDVDPDEQRNLVCAGYMAVKQETDRIEEVFMINSHDG